MSGAVVRHPNGRDVELRTDGTWDWVHAASELSAAAADGSDIRSFRGLAWGASKSEVAARRDAEPTLENDGALVFEGRLNNEPVDEYFIFYRGELARGKCISTADYVNDNNYLKSFASLKALLSDKYGHPTEENEYWSSDLYQDDPDSWGTAVAAGQLSRFVQWSKPSGDVWLALRGENYEVELVVEYNSAQHAEAIEAATKQELLDEI